MTLISIWGNSERLWCAADTKIAGPTTTLTIRGSKIIPLTMNCYTASTSGFFTDIALRRTFGFCYAGSTLVAHLTFDTLSACLSSLICVGGTTLPSLCDVGSLTARLMKAYVSDIGVSKPDVTTEIAIVGCCPQTQKLTALHLKMVICEGCLGITCDTISPTAENPLLLGEKKAKENYTNISRESLLEPKPLSQLERLIRKNEVDLVGGSCQIGFTVGQDFQLVALTRPIEPGKAQSTMKFVGFDLFSEIGDVGPCQVGMNGFAGGADF